MHTWKHYRAFERNSEDGQNVILKVMEMPASFYRIEAKSDLDSVGNKKPAFALETGSGQEQLAIRIANAIASGMLGLA